MILSLETLIFRYLIVSCPPPKKYQLDPRGETFIILKLNLECELNVLFPFNNLDKPWWKMLRRKRAYSTSRAFIQIGLHLFCFNVCTKLVFQGWTFHSLMFSLRALAIWKYRYYQHQNYVLHFQLIVISAHYTSGSFPQYPVYIF